MGEHFPAKIDIGGKIPAELLPELTQLAVADGLAVDWGGEPITEVEDLLRAVDDDNCLTLYDEQASYGEFDDLETFLRNNDIPYDRASDPHFEYGGCIVMFRPGMKAPRYFPQQDGWIMVKVADLEPLLKKRTTLAIKNRLRELLGDDIPPLPPCELPDVNTGLEETKDV